MLSKFGFLTNNHPIKVPHIKLIKNIYINVRLVICIYTYIFIHFITVCLQNNSAPYRPVYHHWFYSREIEEKIIWQPFSMMDSLALEAAFVSSKSLDIIYYYLIKFIFVPRNNNVNYNIII